MKLLRLVSRHLPGTVAHSVARASLPCRCRIHLQDCISPRWRSGSWRCILCPRFPQSKGWNSPALAILQTHVEPCWLTDSDLNHVFINRYIDTGEYFTLFTEAHPINRRAVHEVVTGALEGAVLTIGATFTRTLTVSPLK